MAPKRDTAHIPLQHEEAGAELSPRFFVTVYRFIT